MKIQGKHFVITGGGSGLGAATAGTDDAARPRITASEIALKLFFTINLSEGRVKE